MKTSLLRQISLALLSGSALTISANPRAAMLIGYESVDKIDNFQEAAAAKFFVGENPDGIVIAPGEDSKIDASKIDFIWVHIDRVAIGHGNLPEAFGNDATVAALKTFVEEGGNLLLTKQATQLVHKIGRIEDRFAPGIYGDGEGGPGTDVWTIQAQIGWFNRENEPSQFYDRRDHPIYKDLRVSNAFEWESFPMEGTGDGSEMWREDHNCMWDLNAYAYDAEGANTVEKFERQNNAVVLGQWGHVQDYAVAGIIEFLPAGGTSINGGRIIANGLAACEWSPRQGGNAFHDNLEILTTNSMNYLDKGNSSIESLEWGAEGSAVYFNMQGMPVAESSLRAGVYLKRQGNTVTKVLVK